MPNASMVRATGVLTENQYKAIELMVTQTISITQIAKEVGVTRKTIYNWLDNDLFCTELHKRERQIRTQVLAIYSSRLPEAVEKLWKMTDATDQRSRLAAIREWIDRAMGKAAVSVDIPESNSSSGDFDIKSALANIEKQIKEQEADKNQNTECNVIPLKKAE